MTGFCTALVMLLYLAITLSFWRDGKTAEAFIYAGYAIAQAGWVYVAIR